MDIIICEYYNAGLFLYLMTLIIRILVVTVSTIRAKCLPVLPGV